MKLTPLSQRTLVPVAIVGFVGGWFLHRLWPSGSAAPVVSWVQALVLGVAAALLVGLAWITAKQVRAGALRDIQHAVNRLVLGRATAVAGSACAGAYGGYAVSWLNYPDDPMASERLWLSLAACAASVAVLVGGLLLERACRVHEEDDRRD